MRMGAQILTFPSVFTVPTGQAHWEVLLRARAIENQCYVVAAVTQIAYIFTAIHISYHHWLIFLLDHHQGSSRTTQREEIVVWTFDGNKNRREQQTNRLTIN